MTLGTRVSHKKRDWFGTVVGNMKRNKGVLVDLSDKQGVRVRWIHRDNLEEIAKETPSKSEVP